MWVHGNHLVLLPKMVADAEQAKLGRRRSSTVFFMQIPCPADGVRSFTEVCAMHTSAHVFVGM